MDIHLEYFKKNHFILSGKIFSEGKRKWGTNKGKETVLSFHLPAPGLNNPMDPITQ